MHTGLKPARRLPAFCAALLLVLLCSCEQALAPAVAPVGTITYPVNGASFDGQSPVLLSCTATVAAPRWESSLQGQLGSGRTLSVTLQPGAHRISLNSGVQELDAVNLQVGALPGSDGIYGLLVHAATQSMTVPAGSYVPWIVSGSADATASVQVHLDTVQANSRLAPSASSSARPLRDLAIPLGNGLLKPASLTRKPLASVAASQAPAATRTFRVPDLSSSDGAAVRLVEASLCYQNDALLLYADAGAVAAGGLSAVWEKASGLMVPRVLAAYGQPCDVDANQKVIILCTSLLNEWNIAIGFFNPNDLFAYEANPTLPEWNPTSNYCEMLFVGAPSSDAAFSVNSLAATIAHELTHLVHFSKKTMSRWLAGDPEPPVEDVFLMEGLAHLSESLFGLGLSGGNLQFVERYLEDSSAYALTDAGMEAWQDSVGKRGGMALFLHRLFEQAGGATWNADGTITDRGGFAFLVRLMAEPSSGWEGLANTAGHAGGGESLFLSLVRQLALADASAAICVLDPITGEPVNIAPSMGSFMLADGTVLSLTGIQPRDLSVERSIRPKTMVLGTLSSLAGAVQVSRLSGSAQALFLLVPRTAP